MARSNFGGGVSDYIFGVYQFAGKQLVDLESATVTFWSAETGGTQYTDLILAGNSVTRIPVTEGGQVPQFQGPDGVAAMWADAGAQRVRMVDADNIGAAVDTAVLDQVGVTIPGLTGGNTIDGKQRLQSNVNGNHPLTVWADKQDGLGMLERFTVENTSGGGGCDVNFRNVDVNFGLASVGAYGVHAKFYCAPSSTVDTIRLFAPGSTTNLVSKMTNAGTFISYSKGIISGAAFMVAAWADANAVFTVSGNASTPGKLEWGPGGATALDTNLYRNAAGQLKTDGRMIMGSLAAAAGNMNVLDSGGSTSFTVRTSDVTFSARVIFPGIASSVTFTDAATIQFGTTTGSKIGTSATEKIGFWGKTAVVRPTGWTAPTGTATRTSFATGSVTLPALAEAVKALVDDLTTIGVIGA